MATYRSASSGSRPCAMRFAMCRSRVTLRQRGGASGFLSIPHRRKDTTSSVVSLIGIKPIIKCVSQRSCEHVETRPSLSGTGEKFFLDFSSLDKSPEFAYESTSFDYEFVSQPHDG